jgi:hypothetical protein
MNARTYRSHRIVGGALAAAATGIGAQVSNDWFVRQLASTATFATATFATRLKSWKVE